MDNPTARRPRVLLLSMYPLDRGLWGPTVRITHLSHELSRRVRLDVIAGYRGSRRIGLLRYLASGRLRGLDGIYVESSTFLPAETDVAFLGLARVLGRPVLTYIRDAYQLYEEYYPRTTIRRRLAAHAFRPAVNALARVSSRLAFPSAGLARVVSGSDTGMVLIPPGSAEPRNVPRRAGARQLLFVGNGTLEAQGARRLIAAVGLARQRGADVGLTIVSRPGEEPPDPRPGWLRVLNAEGEALARVLPDVLATVIPRPRSSYNDLAVPVKLYDYLSYGRPLLVTNCTEQALVVSTAHAGLVVGDSEDEIADGVLRLSTATASQLDEWSEHARAAAVANSWGRRAEAILAELNIHV